MTLRTQARLTYMAVLGGLDTALLGMPQRYGLSHNAVAL